MGRRLQLAAIGASAVVWLLSFGLALDDVLGDTPSPPFMITPAADGEPATVLAVRALGDAPDIRPGDRVLALDGVPALGLDAFELEVRVATLPPATRSIPVEIERDGVRLERELPLGTRRAMWPRLLASLAFAGCALFLAIAAQGNALRRLFATSYLFAALFLTSFYSGGWIESTISNVMITLSASLTAVLTLQAYMRLDETERPGRLFTYGSWIFAAFGPLDLARFTGFPVPHSTGALGMALLLVPYSALLAVALTRAWKAANSQGRRKIKWVFLGMYLAMVITVVPEIAAVRIPTAGSFLAISISGIAIVPICVMIGVLRHNFLDVDRILSVTIAASLGAVLLLVGATTILPVAADQLAEATRLHRSSAQLLLIGICIALMSPLIGSMRHGVDRILFAYRFDLENQIGKLVADLSDCETPRAVAETTATRLGTLYQPDHLVFYLRSEASMAPVVAHGEGTPPVFPISGPMVAALQEQPGPLSRAQQEQAFRSLGSFQRAVLETLDSDLVVPVRRDQELAAFIALGTKASGDVYTTMDRTMLALVADKISSELRRMDHTEAIDAGRALHDRLAPYAPGGLEDLEMGHSEVSVLFVDIRGYSQFAEPLQPAQLFEVVNRYTELVAQIVRAHGGTVVDFSGDGLMAVFGAPQPLDDRESAAISAGREIIERVPELSGDRGNLSAGVGVASGSAFVGNVQAVDRLFWTALGHTTNLASRLQSMTRELPASMIIDRSTWKAADVAVRDAFIPYVGTRVRGLSERQDLYILPLTEVA